MGEEKSLIIQNSFAFKDLHFTDGHGVTLPTQLTIKDPSDDGLLDLLFHPLERSGMTGVAVEDYCLVLVCFSERAPMDVVRVFKTRNICRMWHQTFSEEQEIFIYALPSNDLEGGSAEVSVSCPFDCLGDIAVDVVWQCLEA